MTRIDTEELHRLADNPDHTHLELTSEEVKKIATELDRLYARTRYPLDEVADELDIDLEEEELDSFYGLQEETPAVGGRVPTRGGHPAGTVASLNFPVCGITLPREADRTEEELAAWLDLVAERRHAERGEA